MKKILSKLIISILCLLTLLLGTACTEPEVPLTEPLTELPALESWKHQVTNTENLETEHFLDVPDSVVYYDGSFENAIALPKEKAEVLYTAFNGLQVAIRQSRGYFGRFSLESIEENIQKKGAIELRYHQRRQYVGPLLPYTSTINGAEGWDPSATGPFDAWLIVPMDDKCLLLIPYVDGEYCETISYTLQYAAWQFGAFRLAWESIFGNTI